MIRVIEKSFPNNMNAFNTSELHTYTAAIVISQHVQGHLKKFIENEHYGEARHKFHNFLHPNKLNFTYHELFQVPYYIL